MSLTASQTQPFRIKYAESQMDFNALTEQIAGRTIGGQSSTGTIPVYSNISSTGIPKLVPSAIAISGSVIYGSLNPPTTGGTGSALRYYEQYSLPTVFSGFWTDSMSGAIQIERIGRTVTLAFPAIVRAATASVAAGGALSVTDVLPSRFLPSVGTSVSGGGGQAYTGIYAVPAQFIVDNAPSAKAVGCLQIYGDGTMLFSSPTGSSGINPIGIANCAFTYLANN